MANPVIVSVGDTPVEISKAGNRMAGRNIRNMGAGSVFLGDSDVEADATNDKMGWELAPDADFPDTVFKHAIYAVSASGQTNDVMVWRVD
jgi:hypothetical protein